MKDASAWGLEPGACLCFACQKARHAKGEQMQGERFKFALNIPLWNACTCGNKRCPKASDHRLACTGSNLSGQAGSIYE